MSNFLLLVNASVVTITYGVMDAVYRNEFVAVIKNHFHYIFFLRYCQSVIGGILYVYYKPYSV